MIDSDAFSVLVGRKALPSLSDATLRGESERVSSQRGGSGSRFSPAVNTSHPHCMRGDRRDKSIGAEYYAVLPASSSTITGAQTGGCRRVESQRRDERRLNDQFNCIPHTRFVRPVQRGRQAHSLVALASIDVLISSNASSVSL